MYSFHSYAHSSPARSPRRPQSVIIMHVHEYVLMLMKARTAFGVHTKEENKFSQFNK